MRLVVGGRTEEREKGKMDETIKRVNYLFVLQPHQQDLFHQGQFGLLAPLRILANVAGVKGNLVAIGRALIRRLGATTSSNIIGPPVGGWRADPAAVIVIVWGCSTTATAAAPPPCEA